jgi:type IV pilus assembly protein PilA
MLTVLRKRLADDEDGFTLIELMVVVLIIAILIAIAIPTFLGAQDRARDRGAQSNLRNGISAAKTIATDSEGKFLDDTGAAINAADLDGVEGSVNFQDAAPATWDDEVVVVTSAGGVDVTLYNKSGSGKFFCMSADSSGDVTYGSGSAATAVDTAAECQATEF